jgi:cobalt-zinc-cadmium efflux system protein
VPSGAYGCCVHDHGHDHRVSAAADARFLRVALVLIVVFLVCEVTAGFLADSLALLADAGHMLTDAGALAASLVAARLVQRPASDRHSYGLFRVEILAAAVNGITLFVVAGLVVLEAVRRLLDPHPVEGAVVTVVALLGLLVNVAAMAALARANRGSLNVEGAFQHLLMDLYASLGAVVAGVVVLLADFERADPIASLVVAALVIRSAWSLLRPAVDILVEATPDTIEVATIREHILAEPGVVDLHDLHVWALTSGLPVLSAHVVVSDACLADGQAPALLDRLQACLAGHFDVDHSTFQLEPVGHAAHEHGMH